MSLPGKCTSASRLAYKLFAVRAAWIQRLPGFVARISIHTVTKLKRYLLLTLMSAMWLTLTVMAVSNSRPDLLVMSVTEQSHTSMGNEHGQDDANFLCLFTTFSPNTRKLQTSQNVLFNWASLGPRRRVRLIVYYMPSDLTDFRKGNKTRTKGKNNIETDRSSATKAILHMARSIGWEVHEVPRVLKNSLPVFKDMFLDAARRIPDCTFYAYSNGDMLFTDGLMDTLDAVNEVIGKLDPVLLVGRRTNVNWMNLTNRIVFQSPDVDRVATSHGQLFDESAEDYFIVHNNSFPWHVIPDVVVGRIAYDNYVVAKAIAHNVSVIDVTKTVVAVHQSDSDGDKAGHRKGLPYHNINKEIVGKFVFLRGRVNFTQYYTEFDTAANVSMRAKAVGSRCTTDSGTVFNESLLNQTAVCIFAR